MYMYIYVDTHTLMCVCLYEDYTCSKFWNKYLCILNMYVRMYIYIYVHVYM